MFAPPVSTPRLDTFQKPTHTPISGPPAAGRSPTIPKSLVLAQARRRFGPPTIGTSSPALSVTAALKGTIANKRPRKVRTLGDSKPKSWFFDVYEEPEQVQNDRMDEWTISQSAICLDISDDESKSSNAGDDRGKENIDPNDISVPVTRSMAAAKAASQELKKDVMTDDTRSPLGDLNPADYYGEGFNATSAVLVHDDVQEERPETEPHQQEQPAPITDEAEFTFEASLPEQGEPGTTNIVSVIMAARPDWDAETIIDHHVEDDLLEISHQGQEDMEIWESESAKDENEKQDLDKENMLGDSVFALQEL